MSRGMSRQKNKHIFWDMSSEVFTNTKEGQNLKGLDQPITYTSARQHFLYFIKNTGLDS